MNDNVNTIIYFVTWIPLIIALITLYFKVYKKVLYPPTIVLDSIIDFSLGLTFGLLFARIIGGLLS